MKIKYWCNDSINTSSSWIINCVLKSFARRLTCTHEKETSRVKIRVSFSFLSFCFFDFFNSLPYLRLNNKNFGNRHIICTDTLLLDGNSCYYVTEKHRLNLILYFFFVFWKIWFVKMRAVLACTRFCVLLDWWKNWISNKPVCIILAYLLMYLLLLLHRIAGKFEDFQKSFVFCALVWWLRKNNFTWLL